MKFLSPLLALAAFFAIVSCAFAQSSSGDTGSLIFSTVTSGSVTQTLVLVTTTVTSCSPCSTTLGVGATGSATSSATPLVFTGTSSGSSIRPGILAVVGSLGVVSSLFFILG